MTNKILIVSDFYKPHISGITTYIENFIEIYKKKNVKLTILTGNYNGRLKTYEKLDKVEIIRSKKLFSFNRGFFSLDLIKKFFYEAKKNDKVILIYPLVEIFPLIFLTNKPVILNYICLPNGKSLIEKLFFFYFYFFGIISMNISKKIVVLTNSYFYNFFLHNLFKRKTVEILPYIKNNQLDDNYLKYKNSENFMNIGFLGRLSSEKGIESIIEVSNFMNKKNIAHKLLIAGDDKDKRFQKYIYKLKEISRDNNSIKFLGKINEKEKNLFFKDIDFLILPSINSFEAFGLVQLEAMSYGKLVLVSNLKGVNYPVLLTKNGIIFNEHKKNLIYESLIEIKKMSLNIDKKNIIKNYTDHFNKENYEREFSKILEIN